MGWPKAPCISWWGPDLQGKGHFFWGGGKFSGHCEYGISVVSQSCSVDGSSDAAFRCRCCINLLFCCRCCCCYCFACYSSRLADRPANFDFYDVKMLWSEKKILAIQNCCESSWPVLNSNSYATTVETVHWNRCTDGDLQQCCVWTCVPSAVGCSGWPTGWHHGPLCGRRPILWSRCGLGITRHRRTFALFRKSPSPTASQ